MDELNGTLRGLPFLSLPMAIGRLRRDSWRQPFKLTCLTRASLDRTDYQPRAPCLLGST